MTTIIVLSRTTSNFYFIHTYIKDYLGFIYNQTSTIISKEQYHQLKGNKEEKLDKENNYTVTFK